MDSDPFGIDSEDCGWLNRDAVVDDFRACGVLGTGSVWIYNSGLGL